VELYEGSIKQWEDYELKLIEQDLPYYNIFKSQGSILTKFESYLEMCEVHHIGFSRIFFLKERLEVFFLFNPDEIITILHMLNVYNYDIFAFDPEVKITINENITKLNNSPWEDFCFYLSNFEKNKKTNYIKLSHSNSSLGQNAFDYNSRSVLFHIERNKTDNYYLEKEINRRKLTNLKYLWDVK